MYIFTTHEFTTPFFNFHHNYDNIYSVIYWWTLVHLYFL